MPDEDDVYRRLQQHLDELPVGYPATESGVELRILRRLFTPEEAEVAVALSAVPETVERIQHRLPGRPAEELEKTLDRMVEKGAIFGGGVLARRGTKRYSRAPLAIGMYEAQVDRLTRELQEDFEQYTREGFASTLLGAKTKQMRTIPVNARFVPERLVGRYDDARKLIEEGDGPWATRNCVCRQGKDLLGEPCRQTTSRRVCLMIGRVARAAATSGEAQPLTRQETLALLDQAEREGMVLQPANARDPFFICFCCGCCCGVLQAAKLFPRPAEYLHSNYQATVDAELCSECGTCRSRCPMDALRSGEGATAVDLDRCIGCGVCVSTCPTEAVKLRAKGEETVPPKDLKALYGRIMTERFGLLGTARRIGKALLGGRI
ncbi:MAG TPA: 4Fe-4S binding protein [Vicinamibacteria bacterium]|nr:4Fe-4S binding protein [Vicinamibacteria bacterium]